MGRRELLREVQAVFEKAGMKEHWIYDDFMKLYQRDQLVRFQIFDMNWFPGAAQILELADELHSMMTPKHEFLEIAKFLDLEVKDSDTKAQLVELVKKQKNWKVKALDLESLKKAEARKRVIRPIYEGLADFGYHTDQFPKQIGMRSWMVDAVNRDGKRETLYLNKSPKGDCIMVQSTFNSYVGTIHDEKNALMATEYCL